MSIFDSLFAAFANPRNSKPAPPRRPSGRPAAGLIGVDHTGIVGFHSKAFVKALPAPPNSPWLPARVASLAQITGSGTNIAAGLRLGLKLIAGAPEAVQRGALKRLVVLSDGLPTDELAAVPQLADEAGRRGVAIDAISIGDSGYANEALLADVARCSGGRSLTVHSLAELSAALQRVPGGGLMHKRRHRMTLEVLVCDVSPSMLEPKMQGQRKIDVAVAAITTLLRWRTHQNFAHR